MTIIMSDKSFDKESHGLTGYIIEGIADDATNLVVPCNLSIANALEKMGVDHPACSSLHSHILNHFYLHPSSKSLLSTDFMEKLMEANKEIFVDFLTFVQKIKVIIGSGNKERIFKPFLEELLKSLDEETLLGIAELLDIMVEVSAVNGVIQYNYSDGEEEYVGDRNGFARYIAFDLFIWWELKEFDPLPLMIFLDLKSDDMEERYKKILTTSSGADGPNRTLQWELIRYSSVRNDSGTIVSELKLPVCSSSDWKVLFTNSPDWTHVAQDLCTVIITTKKYPEVKTEIVKRVLRSYMYLMDKYQCDAKERKDIVKTKKITKLRKQYEKRRKVLLESLGVSNHVDIVEMYEYV